MKKLFLFGTLAAAIAVTVGVVLVGGQSSTLSHPAEVSVPNTATVSVIDTCSVSETAMDITARLAARRSTSDVLSVTVVWSAREDFSELGGSQRGEVWVDDVTNLQFKVPTGNFVRVSWQEEGKGVFLADVRPAELPTCAK